MDPRLKIIVKGNPDEELHLLMRLHHQNEIPPGVNVVSQFGDIISCRILRKNLTDIYNHPRTRSLKAPFVIPVSCSICEEVQFDESDSISNSAFRHEDEEVSPVVFGIIDFGFDFTHPDFVNHSKETSRFEKIWIQSDRKAVNNKYGYGRILDNHQLNEALLQEKPFEYLNYHPGKYDFFGRGSHGSHVAGIAISNGSVSKKSFGNRSNIIAVDMGSNLVNGSNLSLGDSVKLIEGLDFILQQSGDRPVVINMSLGGHGDSHTGYSLVELAINNILSARKGTAIVQSTGNYHEANCHISGRLTNGEIIERKWFFKSKDRTPNEMEIWYSGEDQISCEIRSSEGIVLGVSRPFEDTIIMHKGRKIGVILHRALEPNTGLNHINIILSAPAFDDVLILRLVGTKIEQGDFHAYIERDDRGQSHFNPEIADKNFTTGSICHAPLSITVGAYNQHAISKAPLSFSSAGPTVDGRMKPELMAPGKQIVSVCSAAASEDRASGRLCSKSGSSMAAPKVASIIIKILELNPHSSISDIRSTLFKYCNYSQINFNQDSNKIGHGWIDEKRFIIDFINTKKNIMNNNLNNSVLFEHTAHPETIQLSENISSSGLQWSGASSDQISFMRAVYNACLTRSQNRGRNFVGDVDSNLLRTVENRGQRRYQLRMNAADSYLRMIAQINNDINQQRVNVNVRLNSAYRSASHQFRLWNNYFINKYYRNTISARRSQPGGEHGSAAVRYMMSYVRRRIATPGYSSHNNGLAVDFHNTENGRYFKNSTSESAKRAWRSSWLHRWLTANAGSYGFVPYSFEPWHWSYNENLDTRIPSSRPTISPSNDPVQSDPISQRPASNTQPTPSSGSTSANSSYYSRFKNYLGRFGRWFGFEEIPIEEIDQSLLEENELEFFDLQRYWNRINQNLRPQLRNFVGKQTQPNVYASPNSSSSNGNLNREWPQNRAPREGETLQGHPIVISRTPRRTRFSVVLEGRNYLIVRYGNRRGIMYAPSVSSSLLNRIAQERARSTGNAFLNKAIRGFAVFGEGGFSAINTYDNLILTVGTGFGGRRLNDFLKEFDGTTLGNALSQISYLRGLEFNRSTDIRLDINAIHRIVVLLESNLEQVAQATINQYLLKSLKLRRGTENIQQFLMRENISPFVIGIAAYLRHGRPLFSPNPMRDLFRAVSIGGRNESVQIAILLKLHAQRIFKHSSHGPNSRNAAAAVQRRLWSKIRLFILKKRERQPNYQFDFQSASRIIPSLSSEGFRPTLNRPRGIYLVSNNQYYDFGTET